MFSIYVRPFDPFLWIASKNEVSRSCAKSLPFHVHILGHDFNSPLLEIPSHIDSSTSTHRWDKQPLKFLSCKISFFVLFPFLFLTTWSYNSITANTNKSCLLEHSLQLVKSFRLIVTPIFNILSIPRCPTSSPIR